jgi:hypothetical protein
MSENEKNLYEVIAEVQPGLIVAWACVSDLKEQDKNAHLVNPVMFGQLTENIKKRGTLESVPFCALVNGVMEIVSGHHRVRAAREASIKRIVILLDTTGLSRSSIAAKQLAHNFINGYDDKDLVQEIAKLITEVDDMIESYLEKTTIEVQQIDIGSLLNPAMVIEWKEVSLLFLSAQFEKFKELVQAIGKKDMVGVAETEKFKGFIDALGKYQKYSDIHSVGMAVDILTKKALEEVTGAEYSDEAHWQTIASCVGGGGSIPKAEASILRKAIEDMVKKGLIEKKKRWQGLVKLAEQYLKQGEAEAEEKQGEVA